MTMTLDDLRTRLDRPHLYLKWVPANWRPGWKLWDGDRDEAMTLKLRNGVLCFDATTTEAGALSLWAEEIASAERCGLIGARS